VKLKSRNFPHPVLNPVTDDFITSYYSALITKWNENANDLVFLVQFKLNNSTLKKLIEEERAYYNVHFECNSTMKRMSYSFSQSDLSVISKGNSEVISEVKIEIPKQILNKKIDVNFFVLANNSIEDYKNDDVHNDFSGVSFKVQKGDVLAFGITQTIHLEKEPIATTNSIFKISKSTSGEQSEPISVYFNDNQIEIILSESSYGKVDVLRKYGSDFNKVLITMLYLPALIDVLFNIQSMKNDEFSLDAYESNDWYRTLEKKIAALGYNIRDLKNEEITPISYKILNSVEEEPWVALENIIFREDHDE
jgi:hypothetical protein